MKKIAIFFAMFIASFSLISCNTEGGGIDGAPVIYWEYLEDANFPPQKLRIFFCITNINTDILCIAYNLFSINIGEVNFVYEKQGIFEISENIKPFYEWQECNIKLPFDTTKSWLFRFEGKNIPKNISALYDAKDNNNYTLVFWDIIDNVKYYLKKSP